MQNQQRPLYVRDILSILENFAPLSLQESYDNAGLICGNPEAEIHSVLLSTDITEEVINEAVQGGHDLLISHHPLTIQGLKNLRPGQLCKTLPHQSHSAQPQYLLRTYQSGCRITRCQRQNGRQTGITKPENPATGR